MWTAQEEEEEEWPGFMGTLFTNNGQAGIGWQAAISQALHECGPRGREV